METNRSTEMQGARDRILEAASDLFAKDGLAVGVNAIIERASVAKATFYHHFPSKADLVVAWLRGSDARWIDWVIPEVHRRTADPVARLVVLFDVLAEWFAMDDFHGCPYLNFPSQIRDPDHPAREEARLFVEEVRSWVQDLAEEAALPEPGEVAKEIHALVAGTISLALVTSSDVPAAAGRSAALQLLAVRLGTTVPALQARLGRHDGFGTEEG